VYLIFVLDLAQSAVVAGQGYAVLCHGWGQSSKSNFLAWYLEAGPILSVTSTLFSYFYLIVIESSCTQSPLHAKAFSPGASTGSAAG
jgi:hypothetical protein